MAEDGISPQERWGWGSQVGPAVPVLPLSMQEKRMAVDREGPEERGPPVKPPNRMAADRAGPEERWDWDWWGHYDYSNDYDYSPK